MYVSRWPKLWIFPWSSYRTVPTGKHFFSLCTAYTAPLGESAQPGEVQQKCELFRFLGIFLARAVMDFRMASHVLCSFLCVGCFWCAPASITIKVLWLGWPHPLGSLLQTGTGSEWQLYSGWSKGTWFPCRDGLRYHDLPTWAFKQDLLCMCSTSCTHFKPSACCDEDAVTAVH